MASVVLELDGPQSNDVGEVVLAHAVLEGRDDQTTEEIRVRQVDRLAIELKKDNRTQKPGAFVLSSMKMTVSSESQTGSVTWSDRLASSRTSFRRRPRFHRESEDA